MPQLFDKYIINSMPHYILNAKHIGLTFSYFRFVFHKLNLVQSDFVKIG